jgi:hypothetical protein
MAIMVYATRGSNATRHVVMRGSILIAGRCTLGDMIEMCECSKNDLAPRSVFICEETYLAHVNCFTGEHNFTVWTNASRVFIKRRLLPFDLQCESQKSTLSYSRSVVNHQLETLLRFLA